MSTHDKSGRPWAKLSQIKTGDTVFTDKGFDCTNKGKHRVHSDSNGLYIYCTHGHHYLIGQADDGEHLVGIYA